MQTANDDVSMYEMIHKMAGGDFEFMIDPPKYMPNQIMPSMNPVSSEVEDAKHMRQYYTNN